VVTDIAVRENVCACEEFSQDFSDFRKACNSEKPCARLENFVTFGMIFCLFSSPTCEHVLVSRSAPDSFDFDRMGVGWSRTVHGPCILKFNIFLLTI